MTPWSSLGQEVDDEKVGANPKRRGWLEIESCEHRCILHTGVL